MKAGCQCSCAVCTDHGQKLTHARKSQHHKRTRRKGRHTNSKIGKGNVGDFRPVGAENLTSYREMFSERHLMRNKRIRFFSHLNMQISRKNVADTFTRARRPKIVQTGAAHISEKVGEGEKNSHMESDAASESATFTSLCRKKHFS